MPKVIIFVDYRNVENIFGRANPYMCNIRNFNELCNQIYFVDKCEAINTVVQLKTSLRVVPPY